MCILVLLVGCNGSVELTATDASASQDGSGTAPATAATDADDGSATAATDIPTTAASQGETDPAGSGGASQSGSTTAQDSDSGTGTSGDSSSTSSTSDTSSTSSSSTTGGCMAQDGPDPVELGQADDLGAAGAYVILAKTAVTNVPGTKITGGHLGVSPVAHTAITGFSLVLDPSGVYATSTALVAPGKVYAADYALPTPAKLTTAVLAMQAAYADAASRIPTDHLNLNSGDLGGLTLTPGIYTWGTSVLVPDDVTLEGCADDVWILQISGDLDLSANKQVLLAGGAQAKNIFWQIAGQATIHAGAHLEGVVLSQTGITFQTQASFTGRAYAQTMVALDQNAVTAP